MGILKNIKDPSHIHCRTCGKNAVRSSYNLVWNSRLGCGSVAMCMTCLYKLHLELNDLFEHIPNLGAQMTEMIAKY